MRSLLLSLAFLPSQALWVSAWRELVWVKIACFCNKILSSSTLTYTLGFSRDGVKNNLTHCVHLKRELELLLGFDSFPWLWRCVVYVCLCYVLVLFVSDGWYSNYSDTRSLFTWHIESLKVDNFFWEMVDDRTISPTEEPFHVKWVRMKIMDEIVKGLCGFICHEMETTDTNDQEACQIESTITYWRDISMHWRTMVEDSHTTLKHGFWPKARTKGTITYMCLDNGATYEEHAMDEPFVGKFQRG